MYEETIKNRKIECDGEVCLIMDEPEPSDAKKKEEPMP